MFHGIATAGGEQVSDRTHPGVAVWEGDFGGLLRQCRLHSGFTQEELAERAGLSVRGIQVLERGGTRPHKNTVARLVQALELGREQHARFETVARRLHPTLPSPAPCLPHGAGFGRPPAEPTPLVGRHREVEAVRQLLSRKDVRMLTLTGPPGVGKTRLALRVARSLSGRFHNNVYFADLTQIDAPHLIAARVEQAFGSKSGARPPAMAHRKRQLRGERALLVLDHFAHVLNSAPALARLIAAIPRLKVLVVSRSALRVRPEHTFGVSPLATPDGDPALPLQETAACPAVELFVRRAAAAWPEFNLTEANASAVAEICRRLDGLPLAIELATAHLRVCSVWAVLDRLREPLDFLVSGLRDLPGRQRSMREAIAYSYRLLEEEEKVLFRRLAVFAGSFTLEAVEQLCEAACGEMNFLRGVDSLVAKSLLEARRLPDGEIRFGMLGLVREYARRCLVESGEHLRLQQALAVAVGN